MFIFIFILYFTFNYLVSISIFNFIYCLISTYKLDFFFRFFHVKYFFEEFLIIRKIIKYFKYIVLLYNVFQKRQKRIIYFIDSFLII